MSEHNDFTGHKTEAEANKLAVKAPAGKTLSLNSGNVAKPLLTIGATSGTAPSLAARGRTVIEHIKKRGGPETGAKPAEDSAGGVVKKTHPVSSPQKQTGQVNKKSASYSSGGLSNEEREARMKALETVGERFRQEDEAKKQASDRLDQIRKLETSEQEKRKAETEEAASESTAPAQQVFKEPQIAAPASVNVQPGAIKPLAVKTQPLSADPRIKGKKNFKEEEVSESPSAKKLTPLSKDKPKRFNPKEALDDQREDRSPSMAAYRRRLNRLHNKSKGQQETIKIYREVIIPDTITVQELANRMAERSAEVIKELMKLGIMATINKVLDSDTAEIIVTALGHTSKRISEADVDVEIGGYEDNPEKMRPRAPVVTIMGHVDHGKTSLLDALRKTNVTAGEAGGITQHIGAYQVSVGDRGKISFIDTPGHAAFGEMRARGAKVTDIIILVVAADDGVKPQTIEALQHAKNAGVPIIVAINKIDKPGADPSKVRTELLSYEIVTEKMGGDTLEVEISALKKLNLDQLLDTILLQSEIMDLKADPDRVGEGMIIEARLDTGRGPVGTALIQHGSVKVGDIVIAGASWGRVRALTNENGIRIDSAGPSQPVQIQGLTDVPMAGDHFMVVENENRAREITEYRARKIKDGANLAIARTMDSIMSQIKSSGMKSMPVLLKGDVHGSVEAINSALQNIGNDEVFVRVVHSGVGGINESDIHLAETAGGIVIGFNVRANKQALELSERRKIEIRYYSIIYNLIDDIKAALSGMLKPELREEFLGNAEILQVFDITKTGKVAGCIVRKGIAKRSAKVRLVRNDTVIHEGTLSTLRRFKDEVKEVKEGYECGMAFENYADIRPGDTIEIFEIKEIERNL